MRPRKLAPPVFVFSDLVEEEMAPPSSSTAEILNQEQFDHKYGARHQPSRLATRLQRLAAKATGVNNVCSFGGRQLN